MCPGAWQWSIRTSLDSSDLLTVGSLEPLACQTGVTSTFIWRLVCDCAEEGALVQSSGWLPGRRSFLVLCWACDTCHRVVRNLTTRVYSATTDKNAKEDKHERRRLLLRHPLMFRDDWPAFISILPFQGFHHGLLGENSSKNEDKNSGVFFPALENSFQWFGNYLPGTHFVKQSFIESQLFSFLMFSGTECELLPCVAPASLSDLVSW